MSVQQLLERRRQAMGDAPVFYKEPVHLVRGEGIWLFERWMQDRPETGYTELIPVLVKLALGQARKLEL